MYLRYNTQLHLMMRSQSWGVKSIPSLLLLPGPLWPRVVRHDRVPSTGQIDLFKNHSYLIAPCGKELNNYIKNVNIRFPKRRCPSCNGYRRREWTWRHKFKSWTRLIAFHIALIPLGKVWIQSFSRQLWVNSRTDWVLQPWWRNLSRRRNTLNSNLLNSA